MRNNVVALGLLILLAGCSATDKKVEEMQTNQNGFLTSYDKLVKVKTNDDSSAMRFVKPGLREQGYTGFIIDPVIVYPEAESEETATISKDVTKEIIAYADKVFTDAVAAEGKLATEPGAKVARIKVAISSLEITGKKLKPRQYIPLGFVLTVARGRLNDMDVQLMMEIEMVDSQTGDVLAQVIKSGTGERIENNKTELTLDMVSPMLDKWTKTLTKTMQEGL